MKKLILFLLLLSSCNNSSTTSSSPSTEDSTSISTDAENWETVYDGNGTVSFDAETGIVLEPEAPSGASDTHAALVLAKSTVDQPLQDFRLTVTATTEEQLRPASPNSWEVFWIFFNYLPDDTGKTTNYFSLKTNGIELGRAFGETDQVFLETASSPELVLGQENTYILEKTGGQLDVSIDGSPALSYTSTTDPDVLYDRAGSIGLYTEDARVVIRQVSLESLDP